MGYIITHAGGHGVHRDLALEPCEPDTAVNVYNKKKRKYSSYVDEVSEVPENLVGRERDNTLRPRCQARRS